jgi:hypothetical protein
MRIKLFLLFICCLITCMLSIAQEKAVRIHASGSVDELFPDSIKFRYPSFIKGWIFYKDGSSAHAQFNLNLVLDEIQFIHPNGDTLSIIEEETVKFITIGKDSFLYKKGIIELAHGLQPLKLGRHQKISVAAKEKIGAYGESSGTTSITSFGSFYANDQVFQLRLNENLVLEKEVSWYFIRNDLLVFLPANRNNLLKLVENKNDVRNYLAQYQVNFKKEADLLRLLQYIGQSGAAN